MKPETKGLEARFLYRGSKEQTEGKQRAKHALPAALSTQNAPQPFLRNWTIGKKKTQ